MDICSKCGKEKNRLFDVVSEEGIVSVCEKCNDKLESPAVKKPFEFAFKDENSQKSVYERLSSVAGLNLNNHKGFEERNVDKENKDLELKELIEKNIRGSVRTSINLENDLVRNFHWIIMRARRLKKITLCELAKEIKVAEDILKLIEKGEIPNGNLDLIRKLELFFGIQVLTGEGRKKAASIGRQIAFDPVSTRVLTIDDLRDMKKKNEKEIFEEPKKEIEKPLKELEQVKQEQKKNYEDLSDEDMDDIIFGRK